ncbi:hypothetical protein [Actinoplanes sp. NPDC049265]|uniref:hypothetical protein n=1 Tax=Actinoplanes sp. NPDC049265 TaxID=3363902 RepID=UPI00371B98E3
MGMMVVGRKVAETADEVRYEFGLDRQFDRTLRIDKHTKQIAAENGRFDSAAGAVAAKIKRAWQEQGEFPPGVACAS